MLGIIAKNTPPSDSSAVDAFHQAFQVISGSTIKGKKSMLIRGR